jgi:hypothetical protein
LRDKISIIKKYHDKKWTFQFLNALYNSIDDEPDVLSNEEDTNAR